MATYAHQASYEYSRAQYSHSNFGHSSYPKPTSQYGISGSNGSYQSEYGGYGGSDSIQSYKPAASSYGSYGAGGTGYGVSSAGYGARGGSGAGSYGAGYGASGGSGAGSYGAGGGSYGGGNYDGSATHMNYNVAGASSYGVQEKPQGRLCQTEALNDPFFALAPSSFPPGTDPKIIECFNNIDRDRNGLIDDRELQSALSNYNQSFNMRTVHLLMYMFTHSHSKTIGPKEFAPLLHNLGKWKALFQRSDKDRNGRIDITELREALCSMGFPVSTMILNLVISKYDKHGGKRAIGYDSFIEACLTIQGLTEKFRAKEDPCSGTASFTYDEFLLSVLPFIFT